MTAQAKKRSVSRTRAAATSRRKPAASKRVAASAKRPARSALTVFDRLMRLNLVVAFLQFAQAAAILMLSDFAKGTQTLTSNFMTNDTLASNAAGSPVLVQGSRSLFDINLAYLIAGILIVSGIINLLMATWLRRHYERDLSANTNRLNWARYAIVGGLVVVTVAILAGVFELPTLKLMFALVVVMSLLGLMTEYNAGAKRSTSLSFWSGIVAGLIPWLTIGYYIFAAATYGVAVPTYVYFVFGSIFILMGLFSWRFYKSTQKNTDKAAYLSEERRLAVLWLLVTTVLAWQVFAGTLRP